MTINTIPVSARNAPYSPVTTTNGSYTLPQYAFIPHPILQQLSNGMVLAPTLGGISTADFASVLATQQRPYPVPDVPSIYGIRVAVYKAT
jgi:hypothetical protein